MAPPAISMQHEAKKERSLGLIYFFFAAFTFAHLARWASAIRLRAAALNRLEPLLLPVAAAVPVPFSSALACCNFEICSSMDWINASMLN